MNMKEHTGKGKSKGTCQCICGSYAICVRLFQALTEESRSIHWSFDTVPNSLMNMNIGLIFIIDYESQPYNHNRLIIEYYYF